MINILRTRRSIRKYTQQPVDKKSIEVLIEALLRSPSSRNSKPWEFIIVDDRELLSKLSKTREHGSQFLESAALGIVLCADSTKSDVWVEDCSIASILAHVTAHSLGLGSCWIQIRNRVHTDTMTAEQYIQGLLGLPRHFHVESIVSIGHPDETKQLVEKKELQYNKIRHNHYSQQYPLATEG